MWAYFSSDNNMQSCLVRIVKIFSLFSFCIISWLLGRSFWVQLGWPRLRCASSPPSFGTAWSSNTTTLGYAAPRRSSFTFQIFNVLAVFIILGIGVDDLYIILVSNTLVPLTSGNMEFSSYGPRGFNSFSVFKNSVVGEGDMLFVPFDFLSFKNSM